MTFSFTEVLLLLITVAVAVIAGVFVVIGNRLTSTLAAYEETSRRLNGLEPQIRRVLENVEVELERVEAVTAKTDLVAADVAVVTAETRRVVVGLLQDLDEFRVPARYRAAVEGAKAGLSVLKSASGRR